MIKITKQKNILIIILVLALGLMSIGFAAFSSNLTIRSNTTVSPNPDNFQVVASASETSTSLNSMGPKIDVLPGSDSNIPKTHTGGTALIKNEPDGIEIKNITLNFDTPGQVIDYTFYIHNTGKYKVYMKKFYDGYSKKCTSGEGTNPTLAQKACQKIDLEIFYMSEGMWKWLSSTKIFILILVKY